MALDPRIILSLSEINDQNRARNIQQQQADTNSVEAQLRAAELQQRMQELRDAASRKNQPAAYDPQKAKQEGEYQLFVGNTIADKFRNAQAHPEAWPATRRFIAQFAGPQALEGLPENWDDAAPIVDAHVQAWPAHEKEIKDEQYTLGPGQTRFGPGGAVIASVPASERATSEAKPGTLEYYMTSTYGPNPTPEQQRQGRKEFNQSDDKATGFAAADVTKLSPAGIEIAALNYRKNGVMPPLGMGDKGNRQAIINRAATLTPADITRIEAGGTDIAGNKADYKANADTLTALTKQRAAIGAFEQTAQKNIDNFLSLAGKVTDTGIPLLNTPVRWAAGAGGSADQAAYQAARLVAVNEIAKITSNPTLSGQLSDSARHEVEAFNPQSATLAQTKAVMSLLKRDMQNRTSALDDEISQVRGRIGSSTGSTKTDTAPATTGGALTYQDYLKSKGKK